jgi:MFS family permease
VTAWLKTTFGNGEVPLGLGATVFLVQVAVGLVLFATFQQYVPSALGTGDAWPGLLVTAYGAARFLSETPSGAITDRIERKLGLLVGFLVMGTAVALMATVRDPYAYLVFSAMLGLGNAFLWPAAYAISADIYPSSSRGKIVGFLNVGQLLGFGVGALLGALIVDAFPLMQFAVAATAIALAFLLVLRVIPAYRGGRLFALQRYQARPALWSVLSKRSGGMALLILAASCSSAMLVPAIRPFGEQQLDASFATLAIGLIPAAIIGASVYVPAGLVSDKIGRAIPFIAGQVLVCVALVALSTVTSIQVAAVLAVFVFCGYTMSVPAWNAAVMDLAPPSHRGGLIGLSVAASGLGLAIGPTVGGIIAETQDAVATLRTAAGLSLATGMAVYIYWKAFGDSRTHQPGPS